MGLSSCGLTIFEATCGWWAHRWPQNLIIAFWGWCDSLDFIRWGTSSSHWRSMQPSVKRREWELATPSLSSQSAKGGVLIPGHGWIIAPSGGVQVSVVHEWEDRGVREWQTDWRGVCSDTDAMPISCRQERPEHKTKVVHVPVNLCSYTLVASSGEWPKSMRFQTQAVEMSLLQSVAGLSPGGRVRSSVIREGLKRRWFFWHVTRIPHGLLLGEVFRLSYQEKAQGLECLSLPSDELEEVAGVREVSVFLLQPRPEPRWAAEIWLMVGSKENELQRARFHFKGTA